LNLSFSLHSHISLELLANIVIVSVLSLEPTLGLAWCSLRFLGIGSETGSVRSGGTICANVCALVLLFDAGESLSTVAMRQCGVA
jgi:hypothetical protein